MHNFVAGRTIVSAVLKTWPYLLLLARILKIWAAPTSSEIEQLYLLAGPFLLIEFLLVPYDFVVYGLGRARRFHVVASLITMVASFAMYQVIVGLGSMGQMPEFVLMGYQSMLLGNVLENLGPNEPKANRGAQILRVLPWLYLMVLATFGGKYFPVWGLSGVVEPAKLSEHLNIKLTPPAVAALLVGYFAFLVTIFGVIPMLRFLSPLPPHKDRRWSWGWAIFVAFGVLPAALVWIQVLLGSVSLTALLLNLLSPLTIPLVYIVVRLILSISNASGRS